MLTERDLLDLRRRCELEPAVPHAARTVLDVLEVLEDERTAHAETQNELAWMRRRWEEANAALRQIIETYVDPVEPEWWERNPQSVAREMRTIAERCYLPSHSTGSLDHPPA